MSRILYKRTVNEDENPLPIHEDDENNDIEMEDLGERSDVQEFPSEETSMPPQIIYKRRRRETFFLLWAVTATFFFVIMIMVSIIIHKSVRRTVGGAMHRTDPDHLEVDEIHWCCINKEEMSKCNEMATAFRFENFRPLITCVNASSPDDCVNKIDKDVADVFTIPNSYLYKHKNILYPIMAEDYENDGFGTYFVAIGRRNNLTINLSYAGLLGKHAFVTNSDSKLMHAYLYQKGLIDSDRCSGIGPNSCGRQLETDIGHCLQWHIANASKDFASQYVMSSQPDVAFVDHLTLGQLTASGNSNYELLCPNGTRANLAEYKSCNLLWQPPYSLAVSSKIRSDSDIDVPADIVEVLHVAQLYFGSHARRKFNMFASKNKTDLLFQDHTEKLLPLRINCTTENYLGKDYLQYMSRYDCTVPANRTFQTCLLPQYN